MKLLSWLITLPLALVTVFLAIANRHHVSLNLDPFNQENPALALDMPLIFVILAAIFLGLIVGASAVWVGQGRHRQTARQGKSELAALRETPARPEGDAVALDFARD
ncbi:MAG: LapA family protein [Parvibaculaceae bacterium]|nr:LapA family protein [Parvibaculaceae bacterium]